MKLQTLSRFLVTICILSITTDVHAQINLGSPTSRTPYDGYFGPVWPVLRQMNGTADMPTAAQLVREGRGFRYSFNKAQPFTPQTPAETEATRSGDCKAKSLWVAAKLNDRSVRYVVGKAKAVSNMNHAWLIWKGPEGWMILDATLYSSPLSADRIRPTEFIPLYSYGAGAKYSHRVAAAAPGARNGDHL